MTLYVRHQRCSRNTPQDDEKMLENCFNSEHVLTFPMEVKVTEDAHAPRPAAGFSTAPINIQVSNGASPSTASPRIARENTNTCSRRCRRGSSPLDRDQMTPL